jgi:hypothetical protein
MTKLKTRVDGPAAAGPVALLVATRKGGFILRSDPARRRWRLGGPILLGNVIHHLVLDPRDRRSLVMAARTGHLGPTVFRSADLGKSWKEASRPPAFPKAAEGEKGRVVDHVFWLTPPSRASGTPAPHRRGSSARPTAAIPGSR